MEKYVLFSPLGMTDPVSNGHDGAMLHICRIYKPSKVYLYISKEINDLIARDKTEFGTDRFTYMLNKLGADLSHSFFVEMIERPDLVDVQRFDEFYTEFENILSGIRVENEGQTILLNVSSGTPAMKSALQTIAAFAQEYVPIQVSTPEKGANPKKFDIKKYDQEAEWECDIDNTQPLSVRAEVTSNLNLSVKIKKEIICRHLEVYDYNAAFSIAEGIASNISAESLHLMKIAKYRVQLNRKEIDKIKLPSDAGLFPIGTDKERDVFEYLLWLQMKQKRDELADFLRGITPVFVDLLEIILMRKANFDIRNYCQKREPRRHGGKALITNKLDINKMESNDPGKTALKALNNLFQNSNGVKDGTEYSSIHLAEILKVLYKNDSALLKNIDTIRQVEKNARNMAAHEIVAISDEWLQEELLINSEKIMKLIRGIAKHAGLGIRDSDWDSYDTMNTLIKKSLNVQERH